MSPTLGHWAWGRDTAALAGHRILWAPAHPKSWHLPPHSSCVVSRGVAGHTVAVVAAVVAASQLPIPSRPRCQLQLPHYYSAQSLPKQPAPLWWEQPEGRGSASRAGHRRPPTAPRCPAGTGALCSTVTRAQTPTGAVVPPWVTKPVPSPSGVLVAHTWLQHVDHGASLCLCPGHTALLQSSTTGSCVSLRPAPEGHWGLGKVLLPWWAPALPGTTWAGHRASRLPARRGVAHGPTGLGTTQPCQGAGKELQSHLLRLGMQSRTWEERGAACPPFHLVSMVNTLCTANVTIFPG